jgi:hypothetical protein
LLGALGLEIVATTLKSLRYQTASCKYLHRVAYMAGFIAHLSPVELAQINRFGAVNSSEEGLATGAAPKVPGHYAGM